MEQKPDYEVVASGSKGERGRSALEMLFLKTEVRKCGNRNTKVKGRGNRGADAGGSVFNKLRIKVICIWRKGVGRGTACFRTSCFNYHGKGRGPDSQKKVTFPAKSFTVEH